MTELKSVEHAVLAEIVLGPGGSQGSPGPCWSPMRRVCLISSEAIVAAMVASGWLEVWEAVQGVTLTPWAADRLGVRLESPEGLEDAVWVPMSDPEPQPRMPRWQPTLPSLEYLPQPRQFKPENENTPRLAGGVGSVREFLEMRRRRVRRGA